MGIKKSSIYKVWGIKTIYLKHLLCTGFDILIEVKVTNYLHGGRQTSKVFIISQRVSKNDVQFDIS